MIINEGPHTKRAHCWWRKTYSLNFKFTLLRGFMDNSDKDLFLLEFYHNIKRNIKSYYRFYKPQLRFKYCWSKTWWFYALKPRNPKSTIFIITPQWGIVTSRCKFKHWILIGSHISLFSVLRTQQSLILLKTHCQISGKHSDQNPHHFSLKGIWV